jgi:hypothetical protein
MEWSLIHLPSNRFFGEKIAVAGLAAFSRSIAKGRNFFIRTSSMEGAWQQIKQEDNSLCFDVWSVFSLGMLISYGTESGCGH